jgi:HAD superfamily hydrolase (TIGR01509 family)
MKGIIFDFDGLIVDTEMPGYLAWAECYAAHGHELLLSDYTRCVGSDWAHYNPATELERLLERRLDWPELDRERTRRVYELLEEAEPLPGVRELLREARMEGVICAVASSSPRNWVEPWLERLELRHEFLHVVTLDDVSRPKPSPELFELALRRLGIGHWEGVVLEDSLNGLRAALAAKVPCVVVPNHVTGALEFEGASHRAESLLEVGVERLRRIVAGSETNF